MSEMTDPVLDRLRSLAAADARMEAPGRVRTALLDEFRRRQRQRRVRRAWAGSGVLAAAVALVFVFPRPEETIPPPAVAWHIPPPELQSVRQSAAPAIAAKTPRRRPAPQRTITTPDVEFLALRPGPVLGPYESGQFLRVNIDRRGLGRYGFPVDFSAGPSVVPADILVGEDGTPRAIRLVKASY